MEAMEATLLGKSVRSWGVAPSVKEDIRDLDQSRYIGECMHNMADLHIHMCSSAPRH